MKSGLHAIDVLILPPVGTIPRGLIDRIAWRYEHKLETLNDIMRFMAS